MVSFWHDRTGSILVEYAVVFPLFILVILGTVDVGYMLSDWALANKAAYVGARRAVVIDAVAQGITSPPYAGDPTQNIGQLCFNSLTGAPKTDSNGNYCPTVSSVCTPAASSGSCTNGYAWNETAFTNPTAANDWQRGIFDKMQDIFPSLRRQNVQISYQTNGLGFVLQPGGLPMNVTVSIAGMRHQFFFVPSILSFFGQTIQTAPNIPSFQTTMQSEDMFTNDCSPCS